MGVRGLWEALKPAGQTVSLPAFALKEGFQKKANGSRMLVLGVDISLWIYQAQAPFLYAHAQRGENPELKVIFQRLARFLELPIHAIFVVDGPMRPDVKRGKRVFGERHWMVERTKALIEAFGYEWHEAPGEAEAELAEMNRVGVVDAVMSDDVDTLVFGANTVIRGFNLDDSLVTVYTSQALLDTSTIALNRGGLVLIAAMSGGDYDLGIPGWGVKTARRLALYGFGDTLLNAVTTLAAAALPDFIQQWKTDIQDTLYTDPDALLGRKHTLLSDALPDGFPNLSTVMLYARPVTSWTLEGDDFALPLSYPRVPDLPRLAMLCELLFTWGTAVGIPQQFQRRVWNGVVMRALMDEVDRNNSVGRGGLEPVTVPSHYHVQANLGKLRSSITVKTFKTRQLLGGQAYKLEVNPSTLITAVLSGIRGTRQDPPPIALPYNVSPSTKARANQRVKDTTKPFRVWIAGDIFDVACPLLAKQYHGQPQSSNVAVVTQSLGASGSSVQADLAVIDLTGSGDSDIEIIDDTGEHAQVIDLTSD